MSATATEPEVTPEENEWLMERLRPLADDSEARNDFLRRAIAAIEEAHIRGEFSDVDQFGATGGGKSEPLDVARASLQQILLKNGTTKAKAYRRWLIILELLNRPADTATPDAPAVEESDEQARLVISRAEPETEAERVEGDALRRIADLQAEVEKTQAAVKQQKERADKLESNNRVLKSRVASAEATASELKESEANARRAATRQKSEARKAKEELAAFRSEVEEQARQASEPQTEHEAMYEAEVEVTARVPGGFRDELGTYLMQLLGTTEYSERPPQWLLDRVDRLAGI